jgi:hypothetical protein
LSETVDLRRYIRGKGRGCQLMKPDARNLGIRLRNVTAIAVCSFGLTAMVGDVLEIPAVKAIGLASTIAPCPKVFCDTKGLEAFASAFTLRFQTNGHPVEMSLTPERYSKLKGPYNRRNVYGAALSFGPRLPEPLWQAVFDFGLSNTGPLRRELGIPAEATNLVVTIRTKTRGRNDEWELKQP